LSSAVKEMSFLDHLEELRWRIIKAVIAVVIAAIPCGIYWKKIFEIVMIYPLRLSNPQPKLIYTSPSETVIMSIKIACAGGLILAAPVVFYQIWKFVSPALYGNEKKVVLPTALISTLFFIGGIVFSYLMFPFVMRFLTMFAPEKLAPMFKASDYFGFLLKVSLAFGFVFELPVISFVLSYIGLINASFLLKNSRYAIVLIFILSAILTPPDVISQTMMALPMLLLYAVSILVSFLASRRNR